jgi:nucleotide-binding universal stress UspA family protein
MLSKLLEEKIEKEKLTAIEEVKKITEEQGVITTTKLTSGAPATEIVKYVKDDDLIVMASKGRKGFNKFFLGSVSEEVLKTAPCTVMVIKEKTKKWTVDELTSLIKEE